MSTQNVIGMVLIKTTTKGFEWGSNSGWKPQVMVIVMCSGGTVNLSFLAVFLSRNRTLLQTTDQNFRYAMYFYF